MARAATSNRSKAKGQRVSSRAAKELPSGSIDSPLSSFSAALGQDYSFETKIGSSVVKEFVEGHSPSDVVRELVQNEFDGGGSRLSVTFGEDGLFVSGNGRKIRADGWERLTVILGTGRVVGGEGGGTIQPKQNGVGSKNFGLRSLFLFGNRNHVRSAGRMAILDLPTLGAVNVADPTSANQDGVSIYVPYRTEPFESLLPFSEPREQVDLDQIVRELPATLVKLALTGRSQGLQEFELRSVRTGRSFTWRQSAETTPCKVKGVSAVVRKGRLTEIDPSTDTLKTTQTFGEIEFSRAV